MGEGGEEGGVGAHLLSLVGSGGEVEFVLLHVLAVLLSAYVLHHILHRMLTLKVRLLSDACICLLSPTQVAFTGNLSYCTSESCTAVGAMSFWGG